MKALTEQQRVRAKGVRLPLFAAALMLLVAGCGGDSPDSSSGGEKGANERPPNIVVWLVDTLRADRTSAYGYERPTTPNLERLAEQGVLFESFHTHSNWTQPSIASLFSGTYPLVFKREFDRKLPNDLVMAASWLSESGYQTIGVTVTAAVSSIFGFDQGFDRYIELDSHLDMALREKRDGDIYHARNVVQSAFAWLDGPERRSERPFFLYLHTMDPHMPVQEHEGHTSFADPDYRGPMDGSVPSLSGARRAGYTFTPDDIAHLSNLYDTEVLYNDAWLGHFVDGLVERDLWDNTLFVVVSDHGEELFERGAHGHGQANHHSELTNVPLVLVAPGRLPQGLRVKRLTRAVDLLPTMLDVAGLEPLPSADGVSLARAFDPKHGEASLPPAPPVPMDRAKEVNDVVALRTSRELYVHSPGGGRFPAFDRLYDVVADPGETVDIAPRRPDAVASHLEHLRAWNALRELREKQFQGGGVIEMSAELKAQLEALGYLDADAPSESH